MGAGGSAEPPIAPAPWRFFGDFLGVQKVTRRRGGETSLQGTKLLYHRPLIRHGFAVPPSPRGEGFWGDHPLIRRLRGHLPLKGKALKAYPPAFPFRGRWLAEGQTDEVSRILARYRWFGKPRRGGGIAPILIFVNPGPSGPG